MESEKQAEIGESAQLRIGLISYRPGSRLACLYLRGPNMPGVAARVFSLLAESGVDIAWSHIETLDASRYSAYIIGDFSLAVPGPREIAERLKSLEGVDEVELEESTLGGDTIMPCLQFPLVVGSGRAMVVRDVVVERMIEGIERMLGKPALATLMYYSGYEYGKAAYEDQKARVPRAGVDQMIDIARRLSANLGFGLFDIVRMDLEKRVVVVKLERSFECEIARRRGVKDKKTGHFFRGLLSGWFSKLLKDEIACEETRCINTGDPYCEFHCSPKEHRDDMREAAIRRDREGASETASVR